MPREESNEKMDDTLLGMSGNALASEGGEGEEGGEGDDGDKGDNKGVAAKTEGGSDDAGTGEGEEGTGDEGEGEGGDEETYHEDPDINSLMIAAAEDGGLDLSNEKQRALAEKMARQAMSGRGDDSFLDSMFASTGDKDDAGDGEEEKPPAKPTKAAPSSTGDFDPESYYTAVGAVYQDKTLDNKAKVKRLHELDMEAHIARTRDILPELIEIVDRFISSKYKHVLSIDPEVVQTLDSVVQSRTSGAALEMALTQMEKQDGYKDVREILNEDGGKPVAIRGASYPSTFMTRYLASHPELLDISPALPAAVKGKKVTRLQKEAFKQAKIIAAVHRAYGQAKRARAGNRPTARQQEQQGGKTVVAQSGSRSSGANGTQRKQGATGAGSSGSGKGDSYIDLLKKVTQPVL